LNKDNEDEQDKQDEHLTSKSSQSTTSFKAPTKTPAQIAFEQTQKKRVSSSFFYFGLIHLDFIFTFTLSSL
jgi:hypothetical protein